MKKEIRLTRDEGRSSQKAVDISYVLSETVEPNITITFQLNPGHIVEFGCQFQYKETTVTFRRSQVKTLYHLLNASLKNSHLQLSDDKKVDTFHFMFPSMPETLTLEEINGVHEALKKLLSELALYEETTDEE